MSNECPRKGCPGRDECRRESCRILQGNLQRIRSFIGLMNNLFDSKPSDMSSSKPKPDGILSVGETGDAGEVVKPIEEKEQLEVSNLTEALVSLILVRTDEDNKKIDIEKFSQIQHSFSDISRALKRLQTLLRSNDLSEEERKEKLEAVEKSLHEKMEELVSIVLNLQI